MKRLTKVLLFGVISYTAAMVILGTISAGMWWFGARLDGWRLAAQVSAGLAAAGGTVILAIVTYYLVTATKNLADLTEEQVKRNAPHLVLHGGGIYENDQGLWGRANVENTGGAPLELEEARAVVLELEKEWIPEIEDLQFTGETKRTGSLSAGPGRIWREDHGGRRIEGGEGTVTVRIDLGEGGVRQFSLGHAELQVSGTEDTFDKQTVGVAPPEDER